MSELIKLAVALCFITCVIVDVCGAEPKARSRRNSRRCPSACLRKIRQLEKTSGPTGPPGRQGPPGPQGSPGKQGTSLILPACKLGEYLTSDGTSLRCEKLNLEDVCYNLRQKCPSNDKDATKGNEGATTIVPGKMVKFMKKNKFQSIGTDAWDIEVFDIDGSLFFGLSQLGHASFQIYKWYTTSFKEYQTFKVMNARNWSPFKIGDDQYFVVATYLGNTCPIFRFDKSDQKFKNQSVGIECKETVDLKPFKLNGEQHIVVANHEDRQPVVIWKWNGKRFIKMQEIGITATYVEAFQVIQDTFIAISGSDTRGPHVFFYKWNGKKFVHSQRYFTGDRPYEMEAFEAGQHEFISVATFGVRNPNKLQLLKWNGKQFESFQNITSYGARRITSMSSPLMGKKTTYLAVINYFKDPEIYYWLGDISTKFEKLQKIEAKSARDVSFFEMGSNVYMLMSYRKHIDIFRGELV